MNSPKWDTVIGPKKSIFDLRIREVLRYWDLLILFVKRDIVVVYKQTILGPIWFFLQPILTTVIYVFVFGNIAKLSTDGIPSPLFYLSGIITWNLFSDCFIKTADTFTFNASIFGKVYYPRLINPLSVIASNFIKFFIQFLLFAAFLIYFIITGADIDINSYVFFAPFTLILIALIGLGFGLIFSSLTTKYKDLKFLLQFGIQLVMYATPVIYPLSSLEGKLRLVVQLNPLSHLIELFKFSFLGVGDVSFNGLLYSAVFAVFILMLGLIVFNRTEQSFMDTV